MIYTAESEEATKHFATALSSLIKPGDVLSLKGTLGMGKSTFARAFIRALAQNETLEVPSPTFTLVQIYEVCTPLVWHVDLYRLESSEEIDELGLDEALQEGVVLIEWPERLGSRILPQTLVIDFQPGLHSDARTFHLSSTDAAWLQRLEILEISP